MNNPLKYTDPSGQFPWLVALYIALNAAGTAYDAYQLGYNPSLSNIAWLLLDVADPSPVPWGTAGRGAAKAVNTGTDIVSSSTKLSSKERTKLARELGREGEALAGITLPKEHITSLSGTAKYRVPDELLHDVKRLREVKNVKSLSYTNQLKDYVAWAKQKKYEVVLEVKQDTYLTSQIRKAISNGDIIVKIIGK